MSSSQQPLIITDFDKGVADSPHKGHALMRNIDITSFPGAMKVQKRMLSMIISNVQTTFTADAPTDVCTGAVSLVTQAESDAGVTYNLCPVTFTTTGTLPAGLSLATTYFLIYVSNTTFKVATTWVNANSGTAINITDAGTGVHTVVPTPVGTMKHIIQDPRTSYLYALDSNGRVWVARGTNSLYLLAGNTITNASGNGLVSFLTSDATATYLFVFRNHVIDVINIFADTNLNTPVWNTAWQNLNTALATNNSHFALVGQDNIIYFCDSKYIGSIIEKAGQVFDPTNGATYSYNNQALDTPNNEILNTLTELGTQLLAGGLTFNKIYPWDRISDSFNLPLSVPEYGIYKLINSGSIIYIFAGTKGNIYSTQGTYVKLEKAISQYVINNSSVLQSNPITWGGVSLMNGAIIFGMSTLTSGNSGVYILYPDGTFLQDNTPYGGSQQVTAIFATNDFYYIGYAGGMDNIDINRYSSGTFASVFNSQLFLVGDKTHKASYSQIEVQTAKPSSTGQIQLSWRGDTSSSFTALTTALFASNSSDTSFEGDIGLTDLENIQIQCAFDGNFEIVAIRLYS